MDIINKAIWLDNQKFGKLEFLVTFWLFCNLTFKSTTICHTFKLIKLMFFNLNVILDKICKK